jgi:predicted DNA-binding transcriptional regulator AlpA
VDPDEILDMKAGARLLGYSEAHFSKILAGKFPDLPKLRHVRVGRTVRMRRSAVLEWFHQAENGKSE